MTRNLRNQLANAAERWMRAWAGDDLGRESAEVLYTYWDLADPADDELRAEVLSRFPASEPPAVAGLDFLPAVEADAKQIVAEIVAPEVLTGEVTSPFGPCSGLAYDKRDNTCTRFAAEYVEWIEDGATNLRRLCTPCADSLPITVSRQPLTRDPGGALIERAS